LCFINRWDNSFPFPDCGVLVDYTAAMMQALKLLSEKGHRKIVVAGTFTTPNPVSLKIITTAAHRAGFEFPSNELEYIGLHKDGDYSGETVITDRLREIFKDCKNSPTAMIGLSDYIVIKFLDILKQLAPLSSEMEVIGFYDTHWSKIPGQEFSTFRIDYAEMWSKALELFEGNSKQDSSNIQWIIPKLIYR
jgi:DNA-binding LacI/PurR family transcriptional regulator